MNPQLYHCLRRGLFSMTAEDEEIGPESMVMMDMEVAEHSGLLLALAAYGENLEGTPLIRPRKGTLF